LQLSNLRELTRRVVLPSLEEVDGMLIVPNGFAPFLMNKTLYLVAFVICSFFQYMVTSFVPIVDQIIFGRYRQRNNYKKTLSFTCNWLIVDGVMPGGRSIYLVRFEESETDVPTSTPDRLSSALTLTFVCRGSATKTLNFFDSNTT